MRQTSCGKHCAKHGGGASGVGAGPDFEALADAAKLDATERLKVRGTFFI
jgi:hypothetical protein